MPKKKTQEEKLFLTNNEVQYIYNWLYGLLLHGDKARSRNKVMTYLTPLIAAYESDRIKILEDKCKRKEDGTPDFDEKGLYQFESEKEPSVREEMDKLMKEEVPFTLDKDRKTILYYARTLLKDDFKGQLDVERGRIYDELLSKLESI